MQADTVVPEPLDPQQYNRYSYARNAPVRYTDPSGHMTEDECRQYFGDAWDSLSGYWQDIFRSVGFQFGSVFVADYQGRRLEAMVVQTLAGGVSLWDISVQGGEEVSMQDFMKDVKEWGLYSNGREKAFGDYNLAEKSGGYDGKTLGGGPRNEDFSGLGWRGYSGGKPGYILVRPTMKWLKVAEDLGVAGVGLFLALRGDSDKVERILGTVLIGIGLSDSSLTGEWVETVTPVLGQGNCIPGRYR